LASKKETVEELAFNHLKQTKSSGAQEATCTDEQCLNLHGNSIQKHHKNHNFDPHQESELAPYQNHNQNRIKIITARPGQNQIIETNHT